MRAQAERMDNLKKIGICFVISAAAFSATAQTDLTLRCEMEGGAEKILRITDRAWFVWDAEKKKYGNAPSCNSFPQERANGTVNGGWTRCEETPQAFTMTEGVLTRGYASHNVDITIGETRIDRVTGEYVRREMYRYDGGWKPHDFEETGQCSKIAPLHTETKPKF